jgi:outer membrane immunogenic protein
VKLISTLQYERGIIDMRKRIKIRQVGNTQIKNSPLKSTQLTIVKSVGAVKLINMFAIALALFFLFSLRAQAQETTKVELGGDYNYLRTNAPPGGCGCISMNGGDAWLSYNVTHSLAAVAQVSAQTGSNIGGGRDLTLSSYLVGPRVSRRVTDRFVPFVQALFGAAHAGGSLAPGTSSVAGSHYSFAMTAGGGLDIGITRHFAIRPAEVDYYLTLFNNGVNNHQNNFRFSSGLIFRF